MYSILSWAKLIQDNSYSAAVDHRWWWHPKWWYVLYLRVSGSCCSQAAIQCIAYGWLNTGTALIYSWYSVSMCYFIFFLFMPVWCVKMLQYFWTYWRDTYLNLRSSGSFGHRLNLRLKWVGCMTNVDFEFFCVFISSALNLLVYLTGQSFTSDWLECSHCMRVKIQENAVLCL